MVLALGVLLAGCGRHSDFLYYLNPPDPEVVQGSYKVKDIKQISDNSDIDILWVIDNSGSMQTYQNSVMFNASNFMNAFTKSSVLHWKMGLISTDISNDPYVGFYPGDELDYRSPAAVDRFVAAVGRLGIGGDSTEKTFDPIIQKIFLNPGFLRKDAMWAIILVSDAPEQSQVSTAQFIDFLKMVKGLKKVRFYGVVDPSDWCQSTDDPFKWHGSKFEQLLNVVKGKAFPICSPNFGKNLEFIGNDIVAQILSPKILLPSRPRLETLKVIFNGKELPGGAKDKGGYWIYTMQDNAIVFHDLNFAPRELEEVTVIYTKDTGLPQGLQ